MRHTRAPSASHTLRSHTLSIIMLVLSSAVITLLVNGKALTVNYTHNELDQPPRKYDLNANPTPLAAANTGAAVWNAGVGAPCGKPALVPPHEVGVERSASSGFVCYDGYDILPKFQNALLKFDNFTGLPNGLFGDFLLTDFIKDHKMKGATEEACLSKCLLDPLCKAVTPHADFCRLFRAPVVHRDHKKHLYDCAAPTPGSNLCVLWLDHLEVGSKRRPVPCDTVRHAMHSPSP